MSRPVPVPKYPASRPDFCPDWSDMKNCLNTMYCWNRETDQVALIPWPDPERKSRPYQSSLGACMMDMHEMTFEQRQIVRDGCDPKAVHKVLMGLEEYTAAMPDDMPR